MAPIASPLSEPPPSVDHPGHPFSAIIGATFASRADLAAAAVHLPRDRAVAIRHPRVGCAAAAGGIRRKRPRVTSVMVPGEAASLAAADGSQVVELRLPADSAADEETVAMACAYTTRTKIRVVRAASAPAAAPRPTASRGVQYTYEGLFTVVGCGRDQSSDVAADATLSEDEGDERDFVFVLQGVPGDSLAHAQRAQHAQHAATPDHPSAACQTDAAPVAADDAAPVAASSQHAAQHAGQGAHALLSPHAREAPTPPPLQRSPVENEQAPAAQRAQHAAGAEIGTACQPPSGGNNAGQKSSSQRTAHSTQRASSGAPAAARSSHATAATDDDAEVVACSRVCTVCLHRAQGTAAKPYCNFCNQVRARIGRGSIQALRDAYTRLGPHADRDALVDCARQLVPGLGGPMLHYKRRHSTPATPAGRGAGAAPPSPAQASPACGHGAPERDGAAGGTPGGARDCAICFRRPKLPNFSYCSECTRDRAKLRPPRAATRLRDAYAELGDSATREAALALASGSPRPASPATSADAGGAADALTDTPLATAPDTPLDPPPDAPAATASAAAAAPAPAAAAAASGAASRSAERDPRAESAAVGDPPGPGAGVPAEMAEVPAEAGAACDICGFRARAEPERECAVCTQMRRQLRGTRARHFLRMAYESLGHRAAQEKIRLLAQQMLLWARPEDAPASDESTQEGGTGRRQARRGRARAERAAA